MTFNRTIYNYNILTIQLGENTSADSSTQNQDRQLPMMEKCGIGADEIEWRWLQMPLVLWLWGVL